MIFLGLYDVYDDVIFEVAIYTYIYTAISIKVVLDNSQTYNMSAKGIMEWITVLNILKYRMQPCGSTNKLFSIILTNSNLI